MVLGKLPVPGRPTIWIIVGQGPTVLAEGADGGCLDIFSLVYHFSILVVVVALLFYVHGKQLRSCRDGQLT